jgi:hypothetical protein
LSSGRAEMADSYISHIAKNARPNRGIRVSTGRKLLLIMQSMWQMLYQDLPNYCMVVLEMIKQYQINRGIRQQEKQDSHVDDVLERLERLQ